ncbi:hypothetical protein PROFUN_04182 [Planoprotostelium fungivorum]|uniref:Uncharacterized protein n=1 Tax=Planoprotostelium fungivorum TaxID=1890364 RepID=A0A2P6NVU4_9EUKA|nr:hypothetical protein PROFUN_04182 [Planoprotostelium fungivorum]
MITNSSVEAVCLFFGLRIGLSIVILHRHALSDQCLQDALKSSMSCILDPPPCNMRPTQMIEFKSLITCTTYSNTRSVDGLGVGILDISDVENSTRKTRLTPQPTKIRVYAASSCNLSVGYPGEMSILTESPQISSRKPAPAAAAPP